MPGVDRRLIQNFEWPLFGLALGLALVGIVNLISAAPEHTGGIPATVTRQIGWLGLGLVGMLLVLLPDYRNLERFSLGIWGLAVVLLLLVLVVGPVIKGSQRWRPRFLMVKGPGDYTRSAGPGQIVVVQNWFEELKRLVPVD